MDGEVSLDELADTMVILGCESAYSLYGGRLAEMSLNGEIISTYQEADRECSDIITIVK
jgi:exopolysaccharide biosynthesis protein